MATSLTLQCSLMSQQGFRTPPSALPSFGGRASSMSIRCQVGEQEPAPPQAPKTRAPKVVSTKFSDVLAFSGPAPERINGRLAMVGFAAAMAVELARGDDLAVQLANGGIPWFVLTAAVFSAASLIPLFKGVTVQSKSDGVMTADAELWNGRFAMLGLVALIFTEYLKGGPIV
uniref:Chloroplastic early light-induced protein n=1 Tax=Crocus sativus TaxID=82528 RepID=A0A1S5T4X8_CROSA|nr:chloroplastic early light-induced protein [Crocus sativus]